MLYFFLYSVFRFNILNEEVSIKMPISKYRNTYINNYRTYAYVRIAVSTERSPEFIWSPVYKLENIPLAMEGKDVTKTYLKNAGPGFAGTEAPDYSKDNVMEGLKKTPTDWTVNDAVKIYDGWGGIDQRWGRNRICVVNWDASDKLILNGKIYQTVTLLAGKYSLSVNFGEIAADKGVTEHCYMVINKGNQNMPDWSDKHTAFRYTDVGVDTTIEFDLTEQTPVAIGFLYNFSSLGEKCAYGFDWIKLHKYEEK